MHPSCQTRRCKILEAATHDGRRLRFIAGEGAERVLGSRYDQEREEPFIEGFRTNFAL